MCNENVETIITTPFSSIHFEEYFIKYRCKPEVLGIEFKGIENAKPVENVLNYIHDAKRIIICPSNPIVSIGTILQVDKIKNALVKEKKKIYAISPIIEGKTVKGPADKLMRTLGLEVSSVGVANYYRDFLGNFIIDHRDKNLKSKIESSLGIKTYCFDTLMTDLIKKKELAQFLINLN
jgi:LPPG:FO 2-phospho-L-lactate transferase